jgi:hypothetical protein
VMVGTQEQHIDLAQCKVVRIGDGLELTFHPLPSSPQAQIVVRQRKEINYTTGFSRLGESCSSIRHGICRA